MDGSLYQVRHIACFMECVPTFCIVLFNLFLLVIDAIARYRTVLLEPLLHFGSVARLETCSILWVRIRLLSRREILTRATFLATSKDS